MVFEIIFSSPTFILTEISSLNKLFKIILIIKILKAKWEIFCDHLNFLFFKSITEIKKRYKDTEINTDKNNTLVFKFLIVYKFLNA